MTIDHELMERVKRMIREAGLRATTARIAILQLLLGQSSPQSHAEVVRLMSPSGVDTATIFRNLNSLARAKLLRRVELGDHVWRFEPIRDNQHGPDSSHPHFLCVDCGEVICLEDVKLTASSQRVAELVGDVSEILVRGHCNQCR